MSGQNIVSVRSHKQIGLVLSSDCSLHSDIDYIKEKTWLRFNIMRRLKFQLDRKSLETIYSYIRVLEYRDIIWDNCTL